MNRLSILCLFLLVLTTAGAAAQTQTGFAAPWEQRSVRGVNFFAELQSVLLYRSDSDFDRSEPLWDEDGQDVGVFATILRPMFVWNIKKWIRISYEAEMGLNFWSRNDPDQEDMASSSVFVMKHRELHASGEIDEELGFQVGYGRFVDPTGLFINHWIGNAQLWIGWDEEDRVGLFVGQVPEFSHEGIDVTENNFARDIFVYGARWDWRVEHGWFLSVGVHNLYDTHLAGQERWLVSPNVHVEAGDEELFLEVDAILQVGQAEGMTPDGRIQQVIAWAAQASLGFEITRYFKLWPSLVQFNVLALSPDDAHPDNDMQHAFSASGKNGSPTLVLTEDEIRDWYDNVDERLGGLRGGFYSNRAGLFLGDVKATWYVDDWFDLHLIAGAAAVLKPENALDETFVGVEIDLVQEYRWKEYLNLQIATAVLVPGGAAGALVNAIDRNATDPIWLFELSMIWRY